HADRLILFVAHHETADLLFFHDVGRGLQIVVLVAGNHVPAHELGHLASSVDAGGNGAHGDVPIGDDADHLPTVVADEQGADILVAHALRRRLQALAGSDALAPQCHHFAYLHDSAPRLLGSSLALLS